MSARRAPYGVREFDLSTARDNEKVTIKADNFAILSAEDSATIRVNSPDASAIPVREISGLTISGEEGDPGIERIYLSNSSGTGKLRLLTGFGVASGDTSTPTDDTIDVSNRSARELGKARLEESGGTLIDPATDGTSTPDKREVATWTAGTIPTDVQEDTFTTTTSFTHSLSGSLESLTSNTVPAGVDVIIQYDPADSNTAFVGDPGIKLEPGDAVTLDVTNTDQIQVNGTNGDTLRVLYEDS
jgi:hypothetical protein